MKIIKTILHHCLVFLLFVIFVRGQDEKKDAPKVQLMSTGETPSEFVQKKIDSHDVSSIMEIRGKTITIDIGDNSMSKQLIDPCSIGEIMET